jgi:alkaline phosphatase D
MISRTPILLFLLAVSGLAEVSLDRHKFDDPPHLANGIKIGEVDSTTATVWLRLTHTPEQDFDLVQKGLQHQAIGGRGQARIRYWTEAVPRPPVTTAWSYISEASDFTHQFVLRNLWPGSQYRIQIETRTEPNDRVQIYDAAFRTAPAPDSHKGAKFVLACNQSYAMRDDRTNGNTVYLSMAAEQPDFMVFAGNAVDYIAAADVAGSRGRARRHWHRMYAQPLQREFHRHTAAYFLKGDRDVWANDCWPRAENPRMGTFTFKQGIEVFKQQTPTGELPYRTVSWGRHLQIWLLEGREFRDLDFGLILGVEQMNWLRESLAASKASFKFVCSATPILGPDFSQRRDNHANPPYAGEGAQLRTLLTAHKAIVLCGDRPWQYASISDEGLREYGAGPTTDSLAIFSRKDEVPQYPFHRVGGGFLAVNVEVLDGQPMATIRHHDVNGRVRNEDIILSP